MQLETDRLLLRDFREDDWPALAAYWDDPRYLRYLPDYDDIEQVVREFVASFVAAQSDQPRRTWQLAIIRRDDGRLIGSCGIRIDDPQLGEANIGYELNPEDWDQGFATEAARAILDFGFGELALHRIYADCIADNAGSAKVMEKLGMRREGHLRQNQRFKERWWDTLIYAVLDHEWRALSR